MRTQEVTPLPDWQAVAHTALSVPLAYAQRGTSLAQAALAGATHFQEMQHHPRKDVSDPVANTRFYYHAHRRDPAEHGHFHLFAFGLTGVGNGACHANGAGDFAHLAALSLNHQGLPTRWFVTNQWVTGERWVGADVLLPALDRFHITTQGRMAPVARWLSAMVQLFRPSLHELIRQRDAVMQPLMARLGPDAAWADRQTEVLAETPADLPQRIQQLGL